MCAPTTFLITVKLFCWIIYCDQTFNKQFETYITDFWRKFYRIKHENNLQHPYLVHTTSKVSMY